MIRSCLRHSLATVKAGCQEEIQWKKAEEEEEEEDSRERK